VTGGAIAFIDPSPPNFDSISSQQVVRNCGSETLVAVQVKKLANFARPELAQARSQPARVGKVPVVFARRGLLAQLCKDGRILYRPQSPKPN